MSTTILTIEDDAAIRRGIVDALRFAGYEVREAGDGDSGRELALQTGYDLLLLDLVLPGADGLSILEEVRRGRPTLPVIILTARGDEHDRVRGLDLGADDYVVKPFSVKELLARVAAVLRRSPARPSDISLLEFAGGVVDFERREIRFSDGCRADVSEREVELIRYLAANRGRAVSREELLAHVWGIAPQGVSTRTIDMHIARLREKLRDDGRGDDGRGDDGRGDDGRGPEVQLLLTVRGKGYMFAPVDGEGRGQPRPAAQGDSSGEVRGAER